MDRPAGKTFAFVLVAVLVAGALAQAKPVPEDSEEVAPADQAEALWRKGYAHHLFGDYHGAIHFFRESIEVRPTAEAHTFLGWSMSFLGQYEEAIAECKKAIAIDPGYGNPYNDIGVYLIELGRPDEAVPWLEKALGAERYCCYQFPHFNLGRVLLMQGRKDEARRHFVQALSYDPDYLPARMGLEIIRSLGLDL